MSSAARSLFVVLGAIITLVGAALITRPIASSALLVSMAVAGLALWLGLSVVWIGVRGTFDESEPFAAGSMRRIRVAIASSLALVLALALGGVGYWLHTDKGANENSLPTVPKEPGKLVSAAEFTVGVPAGARAWRIVYSTTREQGKLALASGLIIVRRDLPAGPRPVIAWAHGTTGIASKCAPSGGQDPAAFSSIPALSGALEKGWAIVATDYTGLGTPGPHPYLIGQGEARSVLDAVRAAHEFKELKLQDRTAIWGHSQGGGAALWAGIIAPTYAPTIKVVGVAAVAPASNLTALFTTLRALPSGALFAAYLIEAYSQAYPDVHFDSYVLPAARAAIHAAANLCIGETAALAAVAQSYNFAQGYLAADPTTGALGARLKQNSPTGPIAAPVLIGQGLSDILVTPASQAAYVARRCAQHGDGPLDYRTYSGRDHLSIVEKDSPLDPDLLSWTQDRFDGKHAASTC